MKRRKKSKQVLIKRIYFETGIYDYIYREKEIAEKLILSTENRTDNFKVEKAEWYVSAEYKIKNFFKSKHFEKIIYMIIGSAIALSFKYVLENWINQIS